MEWKDILLVLLITITIISIIYSYIKCSCNPALHTIVIHDDVDIKGLNDNIINVYAVVSTINGIVSPLPITHEFSHWMVLVETDKNKYYLLSTSPKECIEIIGASYDEFVKCVMYDYNNAKHFYAKINKYKVKNVKISVIDYCNKVLKYYISMGKYTLFNNNCHRMTEYGLTKVLKVEEAEDYVKRSYNPLHVAKDIIANKTEFSPKSKTSM